MSWLVSSASISDGCAEEIGFTCLAWGSDETSSDQLINCIYIYTVYNIYIYISLLQRESNS